MGRYSRRVCVWRRPTMQPNSPSLCAIVSLISWIFFSEASTCPLRQTSLRHSVCCHAQQDRIADFSIGKTFLWRKFSKKNKEFVKVFSHKGSPLYNTHNIYTYSHTGIYIHTYIYTIFLPRAVDVCCGYKN